MSSEMQIHRSFSTAGNLEAKSTDNEQSIDNVTNVAMQAALLLRQFEQDKVQIAKPVIDLNSKVILNGLSAYQKVLAADGLEPPTCGL